MENQRHPIIANHYFSPVSSECQLLFANGHYYGCISLCQSVAEALARFMYETWTKNEPEEYFFGNIKKMKEFKVKPDVTELLIKIYGGQQRHDFHHLNRNIPTDREELRNIATGKIKLLNKAESHIFEYEIIEGGLRPKYELYWEKKGGAYNAFLRLDP